MILQTERLLLREMTQEDFPALLLYPSGRTDDVRLRRCLQ